MAEEKIKCSLCGEEAVINNKAGRIVKKNGEIIKVKDIKCIRCTAYSFGTSCEEYLNSKSNREKIIISNWLRSNNSNIYYELTEDNIEIILKSNSIGSPIEQYNRLILWLGDHADSLASTIKGNAYDVLAYIDGENILDLGALIIELANNNYIGTEPRELYDWAELFFGYFADISVKLELKGWQKYEELKSSNVNSKLAFMAMQFDNNYLSDLFEKRIKKAVNDTGFTIRKLDEERRAGLIDDKLRVEIRRSRFMIADLSDNNNGAYWEAGFAEGLGMPVIYICEESKFQGLHFDTNHHLTVKWNKDKPDEFVEELKATIRATLPEEAVIEDLVEIK